MHSASPDRLRHRAGRPLHLVCLGCGKIAARHARRLAAFGDVECGFASRDPARADAMARRRGGHGYGSYAAALADPGVDAVLITTPPALHLPLTLDALAAGKAVIVEKPAYLRLEDFDQVEAASAAAGRPVLVAENYAYKPLAGTLRRIVESGEIGQVRYLTVNALKREAGDGWRADEALAGGGALFEGGVHWLDLMAGLGLTPESVQAFRPGEVDGIERSVLVVIRYAEGAVGTLHHAWDTASVFRGLRLSRIYGTRGSVTFESNGLFVAVRTRGVRLLVPAWRDLAGYHAMLADFVACLRDGREPRMTLARARRDLQLVQAAYASLPRRATAPGDRSTHPVHAS
jgi:UDP-N-acetylglucosamine 3-dehydrogenase